MSTEILINVRPTMTRVALVENQVLSDLIVERHTSPTAVGSVFRGRVVRVLPGMQAAFVDIGLDKAAFLYAGDVQTDMTPSEWLEEFEPGVSGFGGERQSNDGQVRLQIQNLLKVGQFVLVQVAKDPLGTKGARLTTNISLPGRYLVYMPKTQHLGISRRIEDEEERDRLKVLVEKLQPRGGVIVRTAGEGSEKAALSQDLDYLYRLWKEIQKNYEKRKTAGLLHSELSVEMRALRDMLVEDVDRVLIDDYEVYRKAVSFVGQFMPRFKNRIFQRKDAKPLFDLYDLDLEIHRSMERKVWLRSGGYIVIDEAEALVVIDINTGRYVGKKDLEDTIVQTNLEAIKEIAHQLRVRNIGGIIIIDFIDMEREAHRQIVLEALQKEVAKDRARTTVNGMSQLGLVEMTRKRIRPSLISILSEPCPYCDGKSYIRRKSTIASEIFRNLEREAVGGRSGPIAVQCHADVADWIYEAETETLAYLENRFALSVTLKVDPRFHVEQFEVGPLPQDENP